MSKIRDILTANTSKSFHCHLFDGDDNDDDADADDNGTYSPASFSLFKHQKFHAQRQ